MEERKWYILWSSTLRAAKTIQYIVDEMEGAILWVPSFEHKNIQGDKKIFPIYPQYYFIQCTFNQCFYIEDICNKFKYNGIKFLRSCTAEALPAYLTEEEINNIKQVEKNFVNYIPSIKEIKLGSEVFIISGPLINTKGKVIDLNRNIAYILFVFFQREVKIWVPISNCKIADA